MANQLIELLRPWHTERDAQQWVLGTVYRTEGPCYRKPGAMMLFNDLGQQLGMLSGGCLESDLHRHARKVMDLGQAITLTYDATDEDDLTFQLGIGCGGVVHVLLQPISAANQYLHLDQVLQTLERRGNGRFYLKLPGLNGEVAARFEAIANTMSQRETAIETSGDGEWFGTNILPAPHLLVCGGGIDARPVVSMAKQLGWTVTVWDPRPANARDAFFADADERLRFPAEHLPEYVLEQRVNGAILMAHSVQLDAEALSALFPLEIGYLGLLGPTHRKAEVIAAAKLDANCIDTFAGPTGLAIGAELPESIALSMLAECHAKLMGQNGASISQYL